jgi:hypothetical protein
MTRTPTALAGPRAPPARPARARTTVPTSGAAARRPLPALKIVKAHGDVDGAEYSK